MKRFFLILPLLLLLPAFLYTQAISINTDASNPDPSAILDVKSSNKGVLVPRMSTAQRTAIAAPAAGLLVFDTDAGSFWFYNGAVWTNLGGGGGGSYTAGPGISIVGNTISNTGDLNAADDITTASTAGGDVSGTFSNLQIAANAIGSAEITNGSIAAADLGQMGAGAGQVLQWNGTAWVPASNVNTLLQDADGNTRVQVEKNPNEDILRVDLGGTEKLVLQKNAGGTPRLELKDANFNTFIGEHAGTANTTGAGNTATGVKALYSNLTGFGNTANGGYALQYNTAGNNNTANGYLALYLNTTGSHNTASGWSALYNNTVGNNNTAGGEGALALNTSGSNNTANGGYALASNTTGINNTANGWTALSSNTTGANNTATGLEALRSNTEGGNNTATGNYSLFANLTGGNNTANGLNALHNNTTGNGNTAGGIDALYVNTTGSNNTAHGAFALNNNSGNENTAYGAYALNKNTTGTHNVASGYGAMEFTTTGSNNVSSGFWSMRLNTTGALNTASGFQSLYSNTTGAANVAVGPNALYSNTTASGNVAIGSASLYWNTTGIQNVGVGEGALHINTTGSNNTAHGAYALFWNTTGSSNTANGMDALRSNTTGYNNTAAGVAALYSNTTGNSNTALGNAANVAAGNLTNATAIGAQAFAGASNTLVLGSIAGVNDATSDVNVGIGTTTPAAKLHVENGAVLFAGTAGGTPVSGGGTRLMWIPEKGAFRAGQVFGAQWDDANIGYNSFVGGGHINTASNSDSFVGGGDGNTASGEDSFAGGGSRNLASGGDSFVGGGEENTASGGYSFIGGGYNNTTSGYGSFVGGAEYNTASGWGSFVGGGGYSTASGTGSFVGGGGYSTASGDRSFVGGGRDLLARSYAEAVFGTFNTDYTPVSTTTFNAADRLFVIGNGTDYNLRSNAVTVLKNGRVGIGRNPATNRLEVEGEASKTTPGSWAGNSDARLKKNIQALNSADMLRQLLALQGITYEWNDDQTGSARPEGVQYGFTAQNIQQVFPSLVKTDALGYLQTAYGTYDAMTVEAIRALNSLLRELGDKITSLQGENESLQARLAVLEASKTENAALKAQVEAQAGLLEKISVALQTVGIGVEH